MQQLRAAAACCKAETRARRARRRSRLTSWPKQREAAWTPPPESKLLAQWPDMQKAYAGDEYVVKIRDKEIRTALTTKSSVGTTIRKVALPQYEDHGEILKWLMLDNVPGSYPYTAGTFAFKREGEDPTRMFAGEGDAFRTNRASSC
jgi:methylmalonyl-CoA mutase